MNRLAMAAILAVSAGGPALAALSTGAKAPDFKAEAALDGKEFTFALADALKKGPVVVYFYPKANTKGCDMEAHEFSENADEFAALGASVIGVSADDIDTLKTYSSNPETCAGKLAVASDKDGAIMKAYDAVGGNAATNATIGAMASRTSYVIAPNGEVLFAYNDRAPLGHVTGSLQAVKTWAATQKKAK